MKYTLIFVTALALSLAACSGNSQNSSSGNSPAPVASVVGGAMNAAATAAAGAMHAAKNAMAGTSAMMASHGLAVMLSEENGSKESGKATLAGSGNKTTVTISLTGENTTGKQPAHIHVGPCPKVGAVKYPLSDVVLGKSITVVDAPLSSLTAGNLAINVHESAANIGNYVACGNIPKH